MTSNLTLKENPLFHSLLSQKQRMWCWIKTTGTMKALSFHTLGPNVLYKLAPEAKLHLFTVTEERSHAVLLCSSVTRSTAPNKSCITRQTPQKGPTQVYSINPLPWPFRWKYLHNWSPISRKWGSNAGSMLTVANIFIYGTDGRF